MTFEDVFRYQSGFCEGDSIFERHRPDERRNDDQRHCDRNQASPDAFNVVDDEWAYREAYQRKREDDASVDKHVFKLVDDECSERQRGVLADFKTLRVVRHSLFPLLRNPWVDPVVQRVGKTYDIRCEECRHNGDGDDDRVEVFVDDFKTQAEGCDDERELTDLAETESSLQRGVDVTSRDEHADGGA